jgi:hypothetical protein
VGGVQQRLHPIRSAVPQSAFQQLGDWLDKLAREVICTLGAAVPRAGFLPVTHGRQRIIAIECVQGLSYQLIAPLHANVELFPQTLPAAGIF